MQEVERNFFIIFALIVLLTILLGLAKAMSQNDDLLSSTSLSESLVRGNRVKYGVNELFLEGNGSLHHKPQVLGSNYSGNSDYWKDVVQCESGWNHYDKNGRILEGDKHLEIQVYGIAQFQIRTFKWLKDLARRPELHWRNKDDQIWLLQWAIDNGYGDLWTCY